jgi:hypothetical protein
MPQWSQPMRREVAEHRRQQSILQGGLSRASERLLRSVSLSTGRQLKQTERKAVLWS